MNKYVKSFLHRGLIFGGFGPIVCGIVFAILGVTLPEFSLGGGEVLVAILTTYLIAFVQAGATVFNQIEEWSVPQSMLCHLLSVYFVYLFAYLVNVWIEPDITVVLIFTAIFLAIFLVIWLTVYLIVRATEKKLNNRL